MIKVSINNIIETFDPNTKLNQALNQLGYTEHTMLGVAINQNFIAKDDWETTILNDSDQVDILNPVSGG